MGRKYLDNVENPSVRNIITKLRIDSNKLADSKYRSYRFKSQADPICSHCNKREDVSHRLLDCTKGNLASVRNTFYNKCESFIPGFRRKEDRYKINCILNVNPQCKGSGALIDVLCSFIKKMYFVD